MTSSSLRAVGTGRRLGVIVGTVAAGALLLALAYRGFTGGVGSAESARGLGLRAQAVTRGELHKTVVATGRIEPETEVPVRSEVSGEVHRVHVEEGDRVERGQPLFDLDPERLEDRVNELRAALEVKRASAQYDVVGRASLEVEQARRSHARAVRLSSKGVMSQRELEESLHRLRLAEVGLTDARAEEGARKAAVHQAEHLLRRAERDLDHSVLRAPIAGLVIDRPVDLGAVVADISSNGGTLLAVIADDTHIRLVAEVDENDIAAVRLDQSAEVAIDAFPEETFIGIVSKVSQSGTLDGDISNFEVEIELPSDPRLRVGMSADARVVVHEYRDALLVPNRAILRTGPGPRVRIVRSGAEERVDLVPIRTVYSDGFQTVVGDGLKPGDKILVPEDGAGS
jgi:HlyD family secretion protein